jgi:hypothetical protein
MAAQTQSNPIAKTPKTDVDFSVPLDLTEAQAKYVYQKGYAPLETDTSEIYWIMSEDFLREWDNDQHEARHLLNFSKLCVDSLLAEYVNFQSLEGWEIVCNRIMKLTKSRINLDEGS